MYRYLLVLERKTRGRQLYLVKCFGPKRAFFSCKRAYKTNHTRPSLLSCCSLCIYLVFTVSFLRTWAMCLGPPPRVRGPCMRWVSLGYQSPTSTTTVLQVTQFKFIVMVKAGVARRTHRQHFVAILANTQQYLIDLC